MNEVRPTMNTETETTDLFMKQQLNNNKIKTHKP